MKQGPKRESLAEKHLERHLKSAPIIAVSDDMAPVPYSPATLGDES